MISDIFNYTSEFCAFYTILFIKTINLQKNIIIYCPPTLLV